MTGESEEENNPNRTQQITTADPSTSRKKQNQQESGLTTSNETTRTSTTASRNKLRLPETPVKQQEGNLPVMEIAAPKPEYTDVGFTGDEAVSHPKFLKSHEKGGESPPIYQVSMAGQHYGVGRASALGTTSYKSAWKAPTSGRYKLTVGYLRSDYYAYKQPDHGRIGTTMDSHLIATRAADSTVVSRERRSDLKYRSNELSEEALELFIETGITLLVGRALGLGLIARKVLGEIVDQLIEVDTSREAEKVTDWRGAHEISTTFTASEGESFLLEYDATVGYDADLRDSMVIPFLEMEVQPQWLSIELI